MVSTKGTNFSKPFSDKYQLLGDATILSGDSISWKISCTVLLHSQQENIAMKKSISFPGFTAILMIAGILFTSCGCKKDKTSVSGDLKTVPREPAYAGCYPVVGTSQAKCWDSAGNIIMPCLLYTSDAADE